MDYLVRTLRPYLSRPFSNTMATTSTGVTAMSEIQQFVDKTIEENYITVFSKTYCPYCRRAKALLSGLELDSEKTPFVVE